MATYGPPSSVTRSIGPTLEFVPADPTVPDPTDFLGDETWLGGFYELALRIGRVDGDDSDIRLGAALAALWSSPDLDGPVRDRWTDRAEQPTVEPRPVPIEHPPALYGLARLPGDRSMVCSTHVVREAAPDGNDWLDLCLPLGALGQIHPTVGGYPFGDTEDSQVWREPIDDWLASLADIVARDATFEVGLIGFEVSGQDWRLVDGRPPLERHSTSLTTSGGTVTRWPPTRWDT